MYRPLCLTPVYFGKLFYEIEKWWFNLIIPLLVGGQQADLGFTFCFGSALGKSVNQAKFGLLRYSSTSPLCTLAPFCTRSGFPQAASDKGLSIPQGSQQLTLPNVPYLLSNVSTSVCAKHTQPDTVRVVLSEGTDLVQRPGSNSEQTQFTELD